MNFEPGSPSIRLDFIEQKSERSVMPQNIGVGRNVVLDGLDFASLRRVWEQTFGATPPSSLSRVFLCRVLAYERVVSKNTNELKTGSPGRFILEVVPSINLSCMRLSNCLQPGRSGHLHVGRFESRRRLYSGVEV